MYVKSQKQDLIQNSQDISLQDVKVSSVLFQEVSNLYDQVLAFNIKKENVKPFVNSSNDIVTSTYFGEKGREEIIPESYSAVTSKQNLNLQDLSEVYIKPKMKIGDINSHGTPKEYSYIEINEGKTSKRWDSSNSSFAEYSAKALPLSKVLTKKTRIFLDEILNKPTSVMPITEEFPNQMSLFEVGNKILSSLHDLKYDPQIFMKDKNIENGFLIQAMVEPFKKPYGESFDIAHRSYKVIYSNEANDQHFISWAFNYIKSVFQEQVGYYRLFIFQIKKGELSEYDPIVQVLPKDISSILSRNLTDMPEESKPLIMRSGYICRVLIFEFQIRESNLEPEFVNYKNRNFEPQVHLQKSRILETLRKFIGKP